MITSRGPRRPRCLDTTIQQRMCRTACTSRSGPGTDSSEPRKMTTLESWRSRILVRRHCPILAVHDHVLAHVYSWSGAWRVHRPLLVLFGYAIASQGADSAERYGRAGDQPHRRRDPVLTAVILSGLLLGLEQFDRIAGGVVENDLRATRSGNDVVAEHESRV